MVMNISTAAAMWTAVDKISNPPRSGVDHQTRAGVDEINQRLDRQHLIIQTLLMIMLEKKVFSEQEFGEWMSYVDGLDGRMDGKVAPDRSPQVCPSCNRNNAPNAPRCQYCGHAFEARFLDRRLAKE